MATLKDVAKEAGLTVTTVSRVLNNRGYISDNARASVDDAMKKLHYQPNEVARSLQNQSSNKTVGIIVPHITDPFFTMVVSNLENEAHEKGYNILLFNSQTRSEKAKEYLDICMANRVAGLILCTGLFDASAFASMNIPVISLERHMDYGSAAVECDNVQGGALAAQCLIDRGCRHLMHIGGQVGIPMPADLRSNGFQKVCEESGVDYLECVAERTHFDNMDYKDLLKEKLKEHPETDGIFANSDIIAAQAIQVCHSMGINVPEQIKIVGFDDTLLVTLTTPQLTSVHQPVKEMAGYAVSLLDEALAGDAIPREVMLPVTLIERESTGMGQSSGD